MTYLMMGTEVTDFVRASLETFFFISKKSKVGRYGGGGWSPKLESSYVRPDCGCEQGCHSVNKMRRDCTIRTVKCKSSEHIILSTEQL